MRESTYNVEENKKNVVYTSNTLVQDMISCIGDDIESIDSMKLIMKDENGENVISLE